MTDNDEHKKDGTAIVFVIEMAILLTLYVGIVTFDGRFPVLPTAFGAALAVALVFVLFALAAAKLDVLDRTDLLGGLHPGALLLSMLQVAFHFSLAALLNFGMTTVLVLNYEKVNASVFFAVTFLGDVRQSQQWYLTQAGIVFLLAFAVVLFCLLFTCFVKVRKYISDLAKRRAHIAGLAWAFVYFNIATQYIMQYSYRRVCDGQQVCSPTDYVSTQTISLEEHLPAIIAVAVAFMLDVMAEIGFDHMLQHYSTDRKIAPQVLFLIMYVVARVAMIVAVALFYLDVGSYACIEIFPLWLRLVHVGVYSFAIFLEALMGITESINSAKSKPKPANNSSTQAFAKTLGPQARQPVLFMQRRLPLSLKKTK